MASDAPQLRIGHGYDIHRLRDGGKLMMGGVAVAEGISADAHSDGDVVIHAIVDALLGALGLGDIGEHFPNTDPGYREAASPVFLNRAMQFVREKQLVVINCDVTIMAERPKLSPFKAQMRAVLETILECG